MMTLGRVTYALSLLIRSDPAQALRLCLQDPDCSVLRFCLGLELGSNRQRSTYGQVWGGIMKTDKVPVFERQVQGIGVCSSEPANTASLGLSAVLNDNLYERY